MGTAGTFDPKHVEAVMIPHAPPKETVAFEAY
jgi:hypothetical protein